MSETPENNHQQKTSVSQVAASNIFVLLSLSFQYLGLAPTESGELKESTEVDLEQAKLAIDLSDMLLQKIRPHLANEECRALEGMLANARLRFVRMIK